MQHDSSRTFDNIDRVRVDAILKGLIDHGSMVEGTNPWEVDTRTHGVLLRGAWDEGTSKLTITVTGADWYVPRHKIWDSIESLIRTVQQV